LMAGGDVTEWAEEERLFVVECASLAPTNFASFNCKRVHGVVGRETIVAG